MATIAATVFLFGGAQTQAPQALLQQYKCHICHADDESKTGPAYSDVATMCRGNAQAGAILTAATRKRVHGSGRRHLRRHPEVPGADAKEMTAYRPSLKK